MIARMGCFYCRRPVGPDWYVDSAAGDDANSGKSPGLALRTIAAAAAKISAGDTVALKRGSEWREQLTVPADRVQLVAYGTGARPLFDCSDAIAGANWAKTAGRTNVYECSIAHDLAAGKTFIGCWEDGTRLTWKTAAADVDAMPGSYTLSDTSASPPSPVTLYVHASDSANPATNGKLYEYSKRNFGITASGRTNCTIRGIETRRNMHNDGSLILGNYSTVTDCVARDGSYHNVFVQPGCRLVNVVADEAYHPSGMSFFIWDPAGNGEDIYFEGCQALLATFIAGSLGGGGFGGHGSGQLGTLTYKNCVTRNCRYGFGTTLFQHLAMEGCSIQGDCEYGLDVVTPDATVTNLQVDSIRTRLITASAANVHLVVSGLTAASTNGATAVYNTYADLNLTVMDSALTGICVVSSTGTNGTIALLRNQIASGPYYVYYLDPAPAAANSDYNTVYASAHVAWGSTSYTWAAYKAATGQDAHSTP
jgi:hypothetical protein